MIEQMTGMVKLGVGRPLGYIYHYCKRHKPRLPLLPTLAVSQETGKPSVDFLRDLDLPAEQARVFVFDWLSHGARPTQDSEAAQAAEEASVAEAANLASS
jgi:hypothetical protein